jgi:hypothetical protein
MMPRI